MPDSKRTKLCEVRLLSAEMLHTPGLLRWAINGYRFPRDRRVLRRVIGETFSLTDECVHDLLTGRVPYTVEGEAVVFQYPEGKARRPE